MSDPQEWDDPPLFNDLPAVDNLPLASFIVPVVAPDCDPDDCEHGDTICVRYRAEWAEFVAGALGQLCLPSTWAGTHDERILALNRADIIRNIIRGGQTDVGNCGCVATRYRWAADGTLESSTDNGVTWTPVPNSDPRNVGTLFPPLAGEDGDVKRCQAAENIVAGFTSFFDQLIDQLRADADVADLATSVLATVAIYLGEVGAAIAFATIFATHFFNYGADAIAAAVDGDVWDRFKCNLYCRIGDDGLVTAAMITDIKARIDDDEAGIANVLLKAHVDDLGPVGLTNLGRSGGADGDTCGDCVCECLPDEIYAVTGADWSGGTEATDGGCGFGRFIGAGFGGAATFTIPNRAGRTVTGVNVFICDATLGGAQTSSVTAGGTSSAESPLAVAAGWNAHTWAVDEDSNTIVVNDSAGGWIFINSIQVIYDCP